MAHRDKRARRVALQQKRADHAIKDFLHGMELINEVLPDDEENTETKESSQP